MVLKKAEPSGFFQQAEKSIITDRIRDAGNANLVEVLDGLKLSRSDWVVSKLGRSMVIPTRYVDTLGKIRDISADLEEEHIVEMRAIGIGRKVTPKVSVVDEILTPSPNKVLVTNEKYIQIIKNAVEHADIKAIQTLREIERKGSVREFVFNKDVDSVTGLLDTGWELISSRGRTKPTGKFLKRIESTPAENLLLDLHTHDKILPESDVPTTQDYVAVRSKYMFDWFAICRSTNADSIKSPDLMEDVLFFYSGKGSKLFIDKINELKRIKDENKRSDALYELRFDIYRHLKADVRAYWQILEAGR